MAKIQAARLEMGKPKEKATRRATHRPKAKAKVVAKLATMRKGKARVRLPKRLQQLHSPSRNVEGQESRRPPKGTRGPGT